MSERTPTGAWALWHPKLEWGRPVPVLWPSKELAIASAKMAALWPLENGWQLIRVQVWPARFPVVGDQK